MDPTEFIRAGDQLIVDVHQVVRDQHGRVVRDHHVAHSYTFRGGLILRMREDAASWWIPPGTGCRLPPARFVPAVQPGAGEDLVMKNAGKTRRP